METTFDADGQEYGMPRPRKSRKKRRRKLVLGIGPRLFLAGAAIVVMVLALVEFGLKIAQPYQMQRVEARQLERANAQLAAYNSSNQDLQAKIAYLQRPDGIENAARSQDWVKKGEVSLEVTVTPAAPVSTDSQGFAGMMRRAWKNLTGKS